MRAAEYATAVRGAVDTARLAGASSFQTNLMVITEKSMLTVIDQSICIHPHYLMICEQDLQEYELLRARPHSTSGIPW